MEHGMDVQAKPSYSQKEGQYLAFIHYYTKVNGQPPAEMDMQRYFGVSAPSAHQMILRLERKGLIMREPRKARTVRSVLDRRDLPDLE